jgi:hypothetical protein
MPSAIRFGQNIFNASPAAATDQLTSLEKPTHPVISAGIVISQYVIAMPLSYTFHCISISYHGCTKQLDIRRNCSEADDSRPCNNAIIPAFALLTSYPSSAVASIIQPSLNTPLFLKQEVLNYTFEFGCLLSICIKFR